MDITIEKNDLRRIKSKLVYPLMEEVLLNDAEIKIYAVKPALEEYFRWFPKEATYSQSVSGEFEVDFPDDYTFGIVDARIVPVTGTTTSITGNRLADIIVLQKYGRSNFYSGGYGTPYNFSGLNRARFMQNIARNMQVSRLENNRISVRLEENKVKGYSAGSGTLSIIWAKYSYVFNDVRFERKEEVIELAQSYLLNNLADTFLLENPNLDIELNVDDIRTRAEDLKEKIIEKWTEYPKIIVIPKNVGVITI